MALTILTWIGIIIGGGFILIIGAQLIFSLFMANKLIKCFKDSSVEKVMSTAIDTISEVVGDLTEEQE